MDYRIRESSHGGWVVEIGLCHKGGEHIPGIMGATMPAFIVYESEHFDSLVKARSFARSKLRMEKAVRFILSSKIFLQPP